MAQWSEQCALKARYCQFWSERRAFALVARARRLFLNLWKPSPFFPVVLVACLREQKSACPTLYKSGKARLGVWASVLFPISNLFTQAQFKRLCNSNVNGQWFKCKQISIYFYNPGFWQSAWAPYWFRVTFSVQPFACYDTNLYYSIVQVGTYQYIQVHTDLRQV